ncbi:MAG: serine/threonine-protein kinase [Myxococcota bacterium]|nr:serine/threonine-protein kinase [Myxococcota bacterium]
MSRLSAGMSLRSYRLVRRLGVGAEGEVWEARGADGVPIALKARPRKAGEEPRLRREFERLRTLRLPSVIRVLDVGADQGYLFFTMDLARGLPLDAYIQGGTSLAQRVHRAAATGADVARALAGMHRLSLVHRDLKPANIMVDSTGKVVLLDFGTVTSGAAQGKAGTTAYMAPEFRAGLPSDTRVDLYALGVTLYESLSQQPASRFTPGRPRPSLLLLGAEVPRGLADLIDRLLSLDPAERPDAEVCHLTLSRIAAGKDIGGMWPSPSLYSGDISPLLAGTAVVVGTTGSGRRRMIEEARYQWFTRGYRSIAADCRPDEPLGALYQLIAALLAPCSTEQRRRLIGSDATALHSVFPQITVTEPVTWPPDPMATAAALARVLRRAAPIAVVLRSVDRADVGTAAVLTALSQRIPDEVVIWGTSSRRIRGSRCISPPSWGPLQERRVMPSILPKGVTLSGSPGRTPLTSCARAWQALARHRGETGPIGPHAQALSTLALLSQPFPQPVAETLSRDLPKMLSTGHLAVITSGPPRQLRIADAASALLARQDDETQAHARICQAWQRQPTSPESICRIATHAIRAGNPRRRQIAGAVAVSLARGNHAEVDRWLKLKDLLCGGEDDFHTRYARLLTNLELRPGRLDPAEVLDLAQLAGDEEQRALAETIRLIDLARQTDPSAVIPEARGIAAAYSSRFPHIASDILREIALAGLSCGDRDGAVADCTAALNLARKPRISTAHVDVTDTDMFRSDRVRAISDLAATRREINAATTLSAALIYTGRLRSAADLCAQTTTRCSSHGLRRGEGANLANLSIVQLYLGQRSEAAQSAARCRRLQPHHRDPVVLANCALLQARLAIEAGDPEGGRWALDEAISASQAVGDEALLAESWAVALESAVHSANPDDARRAFDAYQSLTSRYDHWPAVLGRWCWLAGDLPGALSAVSQERFGYGGLCVRAERSRLLLVSGRYQEARSASADLIRYAGTMDAGEMVLAGKLIAGAAAGASDSTYLPLLKQTHHSRWVHLYLGAIHLDAIRRRLRGENVQSLLNKLRTRSSAVDHSLYTALSRGSRWGH